jgi:hypothetical protein
MQEPFMVQYKVVEQSFTTTLRQNGARANDYPRKYNLKYQKYTYYSRITFQRPTQQIKAIF